MLPCRTPLQGVQRTSNVGLKQAIPSTTIRSILFHPVEGMVWQGFGQDVRQQSLSGEPGWADAVGAAPAAAQCHRYHSEMLELARRPSDTRRVESVTLVPVEGGMQAVCEAARR